MSECSCNYSMKANLIARTITRSNVVIPSSSTREPSIEFDKDAGKFDRVIEL
jgi:hypothetical protein